MYPYCAAGPMGGASPDDDEMLGPAQITALPDPNGTLRIPHGDLGRQVYNILENPAGRVRAPRGSAERYIQLRNFAGQRYDGLMYAIGSMLDNPDEYGNDMLTDTVPCGRRLVLHEHLFYTYPMPSYDEDTQGTGDEVLDYYHIMLGYVEGAMDLDSDIVIPYQAMDLMDKGNSLDYAISIMASALGQEFTGELATYQQTSRNGHPRIPEYRNGHTYAYRIAERFLRRAIEVYIDQRDRFYSLMMVNWGVDALWLEQNAHVALLAALIANPTLWTWVVVNAYDELQHGGPYIRNTEDIPMLYPWAAGSAPTMYNAGGPDPWDIALPPTPDPEPLPAPPPAPRMHIRDWRDIPLPTTYQRTLDMWKYGMTESLNTWVNDGSSNRNFPINLLQDTLHYGQLWSPSRSPMYYDKPGYMRALRWITQTLYDDRRSANTYPPYDLRRGRLVLSIMESPTTYFDFCDLVNPPDGMLDLMTYCIPPPAWFARPTALFPNGLTRLQVYALYEQSLEHLLTSTRIPADMNRPIGPTNVDNIACIILILRILKCKDEDTNTGSALVYGAVGGFKKKVKSTKDRYQDADDPYATPDDEKEEAQPAPVAVPAPPVLRRGTWGNPGPMYGMPGEETEIDRAERLADMKKKEHAAWRWEHDRRAMSKEQAIADYENDIALYEARRERRSKAGYPNEEPREYYEKRKEQLTDRLKRIDDIENARESGQMASFWAGKTPKPW